MPLKCQLDFDRLTSAQAPPTLLRGRRPLSARSEQRQVCRLNCGTDRLLSVRRSQTGLTVGHCGLGRKMKRSRTYSSSESDLDDNVDVEKESGDENGYVHV